MRRTALVLLMASLSHAPVAAAAAACLADRAPSGCCCRMKGSASRCEMPCGVSRSACSDHAALATAPVRTASLQAPAAALEGAAGFIPLPAPLSSRSAESTHAPPGAPLYLLHRTLLI